MCGGRVARVGEESRHPVASRTTPVLASREPLVDMTVPARAEPSWGKILATTVKLWIQWRLRSVGFWRRRVTIPSKQTPSARSGPARQLARRRWGLAACIVVLAVVTVAALELSGALSGSSAPAARASAPAKPAGGAAGGHGISAQTAAAAQADAAAWIASQVSSDAIIGCDPAMCTALMGQGVGAGRLLPLRSGSAGPAGPAEANIVVTSPTGGQLASQYAPAMIASFGAGATEIDVRAVEPGGAAAYESALQTDLSARQSAGTQLLRNKRIQFTEQEAAELRAGEVDSRVLATLAALSAQYSFRVASFGDASPGVQLLFRQVTVTGKAGGNGPAELASILALVTAQRPPYLPAQAAATGQGAVQIEFAAPSPLGLLTAVLTSAS